MEIILLLILSVAVVSFLLLKVSAGAKGSPPDRHSKRFEADELIRNGGRVPKK